MPGLHLILTAHTPRHLGRTLLGVAAQTQPADSVWVSCDNDDPAIIECVRAVCAKAGLALSLVMRPFRGQARSGQVRNNAVAALLRSMPAGFVPARSDDRLIFLDQDCCPGIDFLARHERMARRGDGQDVVLGHRIELTQEQTDALNDKMIAAGQLPSLITRAQQRALNRRQRRGARQAFLRKLGIAKGHKPKLLSANFGVSLAAYAAINGFDERYEGWGQEDDDFARRLYRAGYEPTVGVRNLLCFHQWHETRAPGEWRKGPNTVLFDAERDAKFSSRCRWGLDNPRDQATPTVTNIGGR